MPVPKGKRYGGKPKGYKAPKTIEKELERERLRQMVCAALEPMTLAQIQHAQGVSYMILRHSDGTFTRATDEKQIDAACASGATAFRIFTQAPNVQAYADLLNRALDKPAEQVKVSGPDGKDLTIRWKSS
jgi:hypothetical protein